VFRQRRWPLKLLLLLMFAGLKPVYRASVASLLPHRLYISFTINCLHHTRRCEAPSVHHGDFLFILQSIALWTFMLLFQANNSHRLHTVWIQNQYYLVKSNTLFPVDIILPLLVMYVHAHVLPLDKYAEAHRFHVSSFLAWCHHVIMLMSYTLWKISFIV
jgi:hypothetical protein